MSDSFNGLSEEREREPPAEPPTSEKDGPEEARPSGQTAFRTASKPDSAPRHGRLMGLDYGTRRVGVAVSNFEQTIASPLEILHRQDEAHDARRLNQLADEYEVVGIVVGLPMHVGGEEGQKAAEARRFGAWVGEATGRPVVFWDERYTTAIAEDMLGEAELTKAKRRKRLDKVAAQIMLQSYLDSAAGRRSGPR